MSLAAWVAIMFASCEKKDDSLKLTNITDENVVMSGESDAIAVINSKSYVYRFKMEVDKKGIVADHSDSSAILTYVEAGVAYVVNNDSTYMTIKVKRTENPGDYFYIMCENLDIEGADSDGYVAYDNRAANAAEHGLLYDWDEANSLSSKVYMNLPLVYQGVEYKNYEVSCYGELPTLDDIERLLGESIGSTDDTGTEPSSISNKYYDAFVGGQCEAGAVGVKYAEKHTLVGFADNMDYSNRFFGMGERTKIWTAEESTSNSSYPLSITREGDYFYVAYINAGFVKRYGMVVRYVFRPRIED